MRIEGKKKILYKGPKTSLVIFDCMEALRRLGVFIDPAAGIIERRKMQERGRWVPVNL